MKQKKKLNYYYVKYDMSVHMDTDLENKIIVSFIFFSIISVQSIFKKNENVKTK